MMNKQELNNAFSKIQASEQLIQEVCAMKNERQLVCRRKFVKVALVAAIVIVCLATTAFAAPMIYDALTNGRVGDGEVFLTPTGSDGSQQLQSYGICVDVQMNEDAPTSIARFYLPTLVDGYEQYFGFVYKDKMTAAYRWTNGPENWEDEVRFYQIAGGTYDPETVYCSAVTELGSKPEAKLMQLAGVQGYLVEDADLYGTRHFLWSDGDYLFHLEVPDEYTDADLEKVLHSITAVEDILPYCVSMTPEDMESVFE